MRSGPAISLVIAISDAQKVCEAGLAAIVPECGRLNVEVVLACTATRRSLDALHRRHPAVRFSATEAPATLADLRAMGMRDAVGEIVVLLDGTAAAPATRRAAALLSAALARPGATDPAAGANAWAGLLARLSPEGGGGPVGRSAALATAEAAPGRTSAATSNVVGD